jgi:hypothetical protein
MSSLTVVKLKKMCKDKGIKGYSKLRKAELINRPIYIASYAHTNPKPKGIYDTDLVKTLYTMSKNNAYNFIKEGRKLSGFRANTIYKGKDGRGKLIDGVELY